MALDIGDVLTDSEFELFRKTVYNESGITFSNTNRSILDSRLKERLRETKIPSVQEYYKIITSNKEEMKTFLDSVTTNLTHFFRNLAHMDAITHYAIPELIKSKKTHHKQHIRVWSAGCSTGEEPYTLAMVLKKHLPPSFSFEIIASDISLKSLMVAKKGFYTKNRIGDIPQEYLEKYLTPVDDGYQVNADIMQLVKFDYHNLWNDYGIRDLDLVFCRNVLIYFDEAAQIAVVNKFWEAMNDEAFLFIGHSESLFGLNTKFEFVKTNWACFYKKTRK